MSTINFHWDHNYWRLLYGGRPWHGRASSRLEPFYAHTEKGLKRQFDREFDRMNLPTSLHHLTGTGPE